jgi:Flp pilus assembly protein TadD
LNTSNPLQNGLLRFSPDGQSIVIIPRGRQESIVQVWDATSGRERYAALTHRVSCTDVQFSADGRWLVTASQDRTVHIWEVATGQPLADPLVHPAQVTTALFSHDGRRVLTGCRDGMARLWDWRAGRPLWSLKHEHAVHAVAFHPNGRWILTASEGGFFRVWEGRTGKPVTPPLPTPDQAGSMNHQASSVTVTPDGDYAVVGEYARGGGLMSALPVFYLGDLSSATDQDPDDLCTWGELLSGMRVQAGSGVTLLTAEEWLARWRAFRQRHPDHGRFDTAKTLTQLWREARASADARQWPAVIQHLDRLITAHPTVGPLYAHRGAAYAELGQWDKAATEYTRAEELRPNDVDIGQRRALLCLAQGDKEGYHRVCADLLQRFGESASFRNPASAAWSCALCPDAVPDPSQLVLIAEKSVAAGAGDGTALANGLRMTLGAALYRAGRFDEAIQQLNASIAARNGDGVFQDWLFLAMARHRLGHVAEARQWLDKTIQWEAKRKADAAPMGWELCVELKCLRREAQELIEGKAAEPKR